MPFSEERVSYSDTRKRTSNSYVKFSSEYRSVLRILDSNAKTIWKHWIPQANGGRGMGAVCPNTAANMNICPIEKSLSGLAKDDPKVLENRARRRFVVNVLDRTPVTVCNACDSQTHGKKCQNCGADLKNHDFVPLNKMKILEGGPQLFNTTLNGIDKMQREDFDVEITEYDITFLTQGEGRDRKISATPQKPEPLDDNDLIDITTGNKQQMYDLDLLAEPASVEEVEAMLKGATIDDLNAMRGLG